MFKKTLKIVTITIALLTTNIFSNTFGCNDKSINNISNITINNHKVKIYDIIVTKKSDIYYKCGFGKVENKINQIQLDVIVSKSDFKQLKKAVDNLERGKYIVYSTKNMLTIKERQFVKNLFKNEEVIADIFLDEN